MATRLLRMRQVLEMVGLSKSQVYRMMQQAKFPLPIQVSERCKRWLLEDVESWQNERIAENRK